jgi:tetratricopeptide (TPR) repeat protein
MRDGFRRMFAGSLIVLSCLGTAGARPASDAPYVYAHHPVSTRIAAAQAAFDRGLTLVYAYQQEEAEQAFRTAARLDPGLAMAWWGIALALGADINTAPTVERTHKAAAAIARAQLLATKRATAAERDYIEALVARTSADAEPDFDRLAIGYRDRARELAAKYPRDADAAALFAEAAMDLAPWRLWTATAEPRAGTIELVDAIERGLAMAPTHIGLLHFYIHAVEASATPGRALRGAHRLAGLHMEPAAAHLVHMPAHTFLRVGDWDAAIRANEHAVHAAIDFRVSKDPAVHQACGHCLDFLAYAYGMAGQSAAAQRSAQAYFDLLGDPTNLIGALARFHRDAELLALAEPKADKDPDGPAAHVMKAMWHYGRGIAHLGQGDPDAAATELAALKAEAGRGPPAPVFEARPNVAKVYDQITDAVSVAALAIAEDVLAGRLALARGDVAGGLVALRAAVDVQDAAQYTEPPLWPYPVRDTLAAALVRAGDRAGAERVLRDSLAHVPNDGVALAGLRSMLVAAGRGAEAAPYAQALGLLAPHADVPFALEAL